MTIGTIGHPLYGPGRPEGPDRRDGDARSGRVNRSEPAVESDTVQISKEGRTLAAGNSESTLSPERLAEIRERIANGHYDRPEVLQETARRLLESGNL